MPPGVGVGLTGVRLHDLRHTHASLLLAQNTHVKVVSVRLGHANSQTTSDAYSRLLPGFQEEVIRRFGAGLEQPLAAKVGQ